MTTRSSFDRARLRPPPLQTALSQATTVKDDPPTSPIPQTAGLETHQEVEETSVPVKQEYQKFVLTDPVAFRYLEEDASTTVLDRRRELYGYECYVVEQWTTSRTHPTFIITTYTGDASHRVVVGVLSVPTDESTWSPRLRVYFKALNQYHAKRRDTPLGILMVTNLSGFPSSLTVVAVPGGDVRKHRFDFFVNEDLKRLGCSGRAGLALAQPAAATVAKFHQLYRTSDKNDVYKSVIELVKLCQSALTLFDKLEIDYADGLLCDVTERAINDWWVETGNDHYNIEPHDGILGPTTVSGLLGLLMGARNRLHSVNAPVTKDPFDVESMKRGISAFQKQQRLPRTRRLDRRTLDRLHKTTQKAADKERWAVPKAVKNTVAELSGKGGEMLVDAVGRRDKAGIAEIETVDMDRFVQLVYGDRAKWLWWGKPIKKSKVPEEVQHEPKLNEKLLFKDDEHGGFTWAAGRKSTVDGAPPGNRREQEREYEDFIRPTHTDEEGSDVDESAKPSLFKRATNLKDEAKGGIGSVRRAVGFGHKRQPSSEQVPTSPVEHARRPAMSRSHTSPVSSPNSPQAQNNRERPVPSVKESSSRLNAVLGRERADTAESYRSTSGTDGQGVSRDSLALPNGHARDMSIETLDQQGGTDTSRTDTATASIAGSIYNGVDLGERLPSGPETGIDISNLLKRTVSYNQYVDIKLQPHSDHAFPRHLSFSLAEESVLQWSHLTDDSPDPFFDEPAAQLAAEELTARQAKQLRSILKTLESQTGTWTSKEIIQLRDILEQCDLDQDKLNSMHNPHLQSVREIQVHSEAILREERERLEEGVKEIETLAAKLEYEINGLKGRVEDVQAGVMEYEKGVARVEERVQELEKEGEKEAWSCVVQ
ncbi:uncharacterized protein CLAFUR5_11854 [Fulvia fulva]|uniref:STB6-like N-terminal domain-containing protein n=1 Tax=Passalora fulva TaxID=5499 RepID=A0A9Q8PIC0_PASFU|nr:uncharacterized protein CLAFUR5_11854 [Fulvia fulva]KAK4628448.1 hypothetical protein CLAFUR0_05043 [Fulvia fulva]UJO23025.1 hypothetical protein CLAFUR5_11854 [Fulvia fulva]WPV28378.1 hypothetical protein CLAFUW7_05047 [Fulvia fulva]